MKVSELKIGDKVRITGIPSCYTDPKLCLPDETKDVWERLAKRKWPVRISEIDEWGHPWYNLRFRRKNGTWEHHRLNINEYEDNWVKVKPRNSKSK